MLCFLNPYTRMGGTELVYNLFAECKIGDWHEGLCVSQVSASLQPSFVSYPSTGIPCPIHHRPIVNCHDSKGFLGHHHIWYQGTLVHFSGFLFADTPYFHKLPAGIFIPTLGVGACMGRIVGLCVQWLQWKHPSWGIFDGCKGDGECIVPGVYAMVNSSIRPP